MKRTVLAVAASLAIAAGAIGATTTAADARVNVSVGFGVYGGYPSAAYPYYYPRYAYPAYRYRAYPYAAPRRLVCYDVIKKRVYWRHHVRHVVYVKDRSCHWKYRW